MSAGEQDVGPVTVLRRMMLGADALCDCFIQMNFDARKNNDSCTPTKKKIIKNYSALMQMSEPLFYSIRTQNLKCF